MRGKAVQHFATSADTTDDWECSGGTITNSAVRSIDWTAPNVTGTYTVTATVGAAVLIVTITVTAVVPFAPDWGFDALAGKRVLLFQAESGGIQTRSKGRSDTFPFIRNTAKKTEHDEMKTFWDDNYPGRLVYFTVPGQTEDLWYLNSDFKSKGQRTNLWGYAFDLLRVS